MNNPIPDIALVARPYDLLKPYERNARTHSTKQVAMIAHSLVEFGWTSPVLVDADDNVLAGHGRLLAAQLVWEVGVTVEGQMVREIPGVQRGWVPTIPLGKLTPAQRKAYVIADNKLAEAAGWDQDMLVMELGELAEEGFNLGLIGFSDQELATLLGDGPTTGQENVAPPVPKVPVSRMGDLWHCGPHRVLCGDALNEACYAVLLREGAADVLWTDPPYNVDYKGGAIANDDLGTGYSQFLGTALKRAYGALKDAAPIYVAHADTEGLAVRTAFAAAGFKLSGCLIWVKDSLVLGRSDYQWRHEPILYGWKPGAAHRWLGGRKQTTVQELEGYPVTKCADGTTQMVMGDHVLVFRGDVTVQEVLGSIFHEERPKVSELHPTMKPVALIERQLRNHCQKGEVALDPFAGSGSTLIACERLGLHGRMLELEPGLVDVIVRRWQDYTGKVARLEDGRTFGEVDGQRTASP